MIATTPEAPYYAIIFTSLRTEGDQGYGAMADRMAELAAQQRSSRGYPGAESARDGVGITVSYWRDLEAIRAWKAHAEHLIAQQRGPSRWYVDYCVRIARVERDYRLDDSPEAEGGA